MSAADWTAEAEDRITLRVQSKREEAEAARRFAEAAAATVELPEFTSLRDLLAEPITAPKYRIDGLWPTGGRVILAAPKKAGKTTFLGNLIRSLVDGDPFLDRFEVTPVTGSVILFDFEMPKDLLLDWLREQRIKNDDRVHVIPMKGRAAAFDLRNPKIRERLADKIRKLDGEIILGDPIKDVMDALGLSEANEAGLLLTGYDALLAEAGASEGLWAHHMGHGAERSRGDSTFGGWPDAEWKILTGDGANIGDKKTDQEIRDTPRSFWAFGRDVDQVAVTMDYAREGRRLTLATNGDGTPVRRADAKTERRRAELLAYLTDHPGCLGTEIEAAGINYRRAGLMDGLILAGLAYRQDAVKGRGVHHFAGQDPQVDAFDVAAGRS